MNIMERRYSIRHLISKGVIPATVIADIEIRDKIDQLERCGASHGAAVRHVADEVGRTIQAIYISLKRNRF